MKIEIWSDIMCPFCYIGKRQLESALAEFPNDDFEIEWKSFQLDPTIEPQSGKDVYTFLAERKGISAEQSIEMHKGVTERAKSVGLDYHFDKAVISNSLTAHRIIHLAKAKKLGDEMEDALCQAMKEYRSSRYRFPDEVVEGNKFDMLKETEGNY